jgi:hypothetical protein
MEHWTIIENKYNPRVEKYVLYDLHRCFISERSSLDAPCSEAVSGLHGKEVASGSNVFFSFRLSSFIPSMLRSFISKIPYKRASQSVLFTKHHYDD